MVEQSPLHEPIFQRRPDLIGSPTPEALVVLDVQSGDFYSFSGPSARIWELLEAPISASEAVARLISEFDIDEHSCRAEVEAHLARLESEGLVKAVDTGS